MRTISLHSEDLLLLLNKEKIATMKELKKTLGTHTSMTVFRKLKGLNYLSSCSHSGRYYTLRRIARFNKNGLWSFNSVLFSTYTTLAETIRMLIEMSPQGHTAIEVERLLNIKPNEPLLELIKSKKVKREKVLGNYIYFSSSNAIKIQQELMRKNAKVEIRLEKLKSDVLMDEVKASIIIFFSILDERQRRLYAGLESLKFGEGGDKLISEILGLNVKTVRKGRHELLQNEINLDVIRSVGGGRKEVKKNPKNSRSD